MKTLFFAGFTLSFLVLSFTMIALCILSMVVFVSLNFIGGYTLLGIVAISLPFIWVMSQMVKEGLRS